MDSYTDILLELYRHPLNKKRITHPSLYHHEVNPICGDEVELFVIVKDERVTDIGFEGNGCAISQAAASVTTEELKGKTLAEAQHITPTTILSLLGLEKLNPTRLRCATLALEALKKAIKTA